MWKKMLSKILIYLSKPLSVFYPYQSFFVQYDIFFPFAADFLGLQIQTFALSVLTIKNHVRRTMRKKLPAVLKFDGDIAPLAVLGVSLKHLIKKNFAMIIKIKQQRKIGKINGKPLYIFFNQIQNDIKYELILANGILEKVEICLYSV